MVDKNHDGQVDFGEFQAMIEHNRIPGFADAFATDNGHFFEANDAEFPDATRLRDAKLAQTDTRRFCPDRCLATGYCDALEDLLEMTTTQVQKFCDSCSQGDECVLDYA
jgi:hypothetical protein